MSTPEELGETPARRRGRRAGMQSLSKHPPRPISEIWRTATEEERQEAKRRAGELLSYWRGLTGSAQVSRTLGIRRNLVYPLQKRALAGMAVGLLPRSVCRRRAEGAAFVRQREVETLKKEVVRLTKERENLLGLIRLLRHLSSSSAASRTPEEKKDGVRKKAGRSENARANRGADERRPGERGGEESDRAGERHLRADTQKLEKAE